MDTPITTRLRILCDRAGLKPKPFGQFCGLKSSSHMGMIFDGSVKEPELPTLHTIADACGVERPWLVYGVGIAPDESALERLAQRAAEWNRARKNTEAA